MPASRRSASAAPSTASPSRLMLRLTSCFLMALRVRPSRAGVASIIRWLTMPRSTLRAIGTTKPGISGANVPPSAIKPRSGAGRNFGIFVFRALRLRAATLRSSGRTTPSTKPTAKSRPFGSRNRPASLRAAAELLVWSAVLSHSETCAIAASASSDLFARAGIAVTGCVMAPLLLTQ